MEAMAGAVEATDGAVEATDGAVAAMAVEGLGKAVAVVAGELEAGPWAGQADRLVAAEAESGVTMVETWVAAMEEAEVRGVAPRAVVETKGWAELRAKEVVQAHGRTARS